MNGTSHSNTEIREELPQLPHAQSHSEPKIQTVPVFLRRINPNFVKYCSPKMISFGPIHHHLDDTDLKLGQELKTRWADLYLEDFKSHMVHISYAHGGPQGLKDPKVFLKERLTSNFPSIKNLFSEDVTQKYYDNQLADMLLVDGCALLYFMDNVDEQHPEKLNIKLDQLMYIWRDIILLENQLPLKLLTLLLYNEHESNLIYSLYNFLFMGLTRRNRQESIFVYRDELKPPHLLGYIRLFHSFGEPEEPSLLDRIISFMCTTVPRLFKKESTLPHREEDPRHRNKPLRLEDPWHRYKNIRDLTNVGIQVEANKTSEWKWSNISFTSNTFSGQLMLPGIVVDDVAPYFFHNMIAYEMLPDFPNNYEFCSYFSLMDSLIDDAEDVKELRAAGVLQNFLGSDEEVAKLFNELGGVLPTKMFNYTTSVVAYNNKYIQIKQQIDKHYRNKWKTSLAQLLTTYFNDTWSVIAFFAAVLALVLTSLQTWYTIHPK